MLKQLIILCLVLLFTSDEQTPLLSNHHGITMGTTYHIKWLSNNHTINQRLPALIKLKLDNINMLMSTYLKNSELSYVNAQPTRTTTKISTDLFNIIKLALRISQQTGGAFDITVGPLVNLWGFGATGRAVNIPSEASIQRELKRVGYWNILLDANTQTLHKMTNNYIDLSAIAKGYAVDLIGDLLNAKGIKNYLVEIGGDLRAAGTRPDQNSWRIGINLPDKEQASLQTAIKLTNMAVATSGDYRNYFSKNNHRYSHTIDPATGKPIKHLLASVTVLMPTAARADAFATALMVLGPDKGMQYAEHNSISAYFIIRADNKFSVRQTSNFTKLQN